MSVELRKKMYGYSYIWHNTEHTAQSADQYYSSYSYQSSSSISYSDLHHDCKPYEQTIEFFTVSLYSP